MWEGQERKRLIKLAGRQFTVEQVRDMVQPSADAHPIYCVVREHGCEVLRMWGWPHGLYEVTIEDDVQFFAMIRHLAERRLVFDSDAEALAYGRAKGLLERPQTLDQ